MDGTFIKELEDLAVRNRTEIVSVDGRNFTLGDLREITEVYHILDRVELSDLYSFARIINEEAARLTSKKLFIKVNKDLTVEMFTEFDDRMRRRTPYVAVAHLPQVRFDEWLNYEEFVINLRSKFVRNEDVENLLKTIANITNSDKTEFSDNGVVQNVKVSRGTQLSTDEIKSIVDLKPFRTFAEIEQPASEFLFRIDTRGGEPRYRLTEADGGAWKLEAKQKIGQLLRDSIISENVIVLF